MPNLIIYRKYYKGKYSTMSISETSTATVTLLIEKGLFGPLLLPNADLECPIIAFQWEFEFYSYPGSLKG